MQPFDGVAEGIANIGGSPHETGAVPRQSVTENLIILHENHTAKETGAGFEAQPALKHFLHDPYETP